MMQLALATLTLIGLGFDFLGAIIVLAPDSNTAQSMIRRRDYFSSIDSGQEKLVQEGFLRQGDRGISEIVDITEEKDNSQYNPDYILFTDGISIIEELKLEKEAFLQLIGDEYTIYNIPQTIKKIISDSIDENDSESELRAIEEFLDSKFERLSGMFVVFIIIEENNGGSIEVEAIFKKESFFFFFCNKKPSP